MEDTFEGAAGKMQKSPISPVQIMKKAEKQMRREKVVSAGKQYAPTLYTVLVNPDDDQRLFGFYPTLAGECETRLAATASADGLAMDGHPLVALHRGRRLEARQVRHHRRSGKRSDRGAASRRGNAALRHGRRRNPRPSPRPPRTAIPPMRSSAPPSLSQCRSLPSSSLRPQTPSRQTPAAIMASRFRRGNDQRRSRVQPQPAAKPPLPYVPENEIDYSLNYGEYTFDSKNFEDYRKADESDQEQAAAAPNVTGEERRSSLPMPPRMRGFTELHPTRTRRSTSKPRRPASKTLIAQSMPPFLSPNIPPQQYGYAPQGMGADPAPNPAYPPMGMGMQPGNAYAYARQGQPYGAYPDMHQQAAPAPAPAYGAAAPHRLHSRPEPPK